LERIAAGDALIHPASCRTAWLIVGSFGQFELGIPNAAQVGSMKFWRLAKSPLPPPAHAAPAPPNQRAATAPARREMVEDLIDLRMM